MTDKLQFQGPGNVHAGLLDFNESFFDKIFTLRYCDLEFSCLNT